MQKKPGSRNRLAALLMAGFGPGAAIYNWREARLAEKKHPPDGEFITVDGVRLHYTDTGESKPAAVLLHGNGVTSADWRLSGVTGKAEGRYRVIAFDRPGFGYSERPNRRTWTPEAQADLIKAALDTLGAGKPILVGHSWGALVAAAFAIRHPDALRGVVLVSGYFFPTSRVDSIVFSPPSIPVAGAILRYTFSPLAGQMMAPSIIRKIFAPEEVPERFLKEFPLPLTLRPWQIRAATEEASTLVRAAASLKGHYDSISVPTVIISGNADEITDFHLQSARLHHIIANSRLVVLPRTGHMPHYSDPGAIVHAIDSIAG
jgi:pimeloyl-ACP methyl ester carboxylesterase